MRTTAIKINLTQKYIGIFCITHTILFVLTAILLTPQSSQAAHGVLDANRETSWRWEEFDLHNRASMKPLYDSSPFSYHIQISASLNGEGYEGIEDEDLSNTRTTGVSYNSAGSYHMTSLSEVFGEVEIEIERDESDNTNTSFNIDSLYMLQSTPNNHVKYGFGRQQISDDGWLIDSSIDGLSFLGQSEISTITTVIGKLNANTDTTYDDDDEEGSDDNLLLYGRAFRTLGTSGHSSVYLAHLRNTNNKTWIGINALASPSTDMDLWGKLSSLTGQENDRSINAFAFSAGLTYTRNESSFEPTFKLAYAVGSGDDGIGDDSRFRQIGIDGSSDMYGNTLEPDLTNLHIVSAGIDVYPTENISIEILYNNYRQNIPSTEFSSGSVDLQPDGVSRSLGQALEMSIGFDKPNGFSIGFSYGRLWADNGIKADAGLLEVEWNW